MKSTLLNKTAEEKKRTKAKQSKCKTNNMIELPTKKHKNLLKYQWTQ